MLSMAALALIVASCSNDEEKVPESKVMNAEPIRISQQMTGVETKGAVTPGTDMQAVILMADGDNPDFTTFTPNIENKVSDQNTFTKDADRANVSNTKFSASTTAGEIDLTPVLYYPVDNEDTKAWILGVSPLGTVGASVVTFSDVDGFQDVMYAGKTDAGSSKTPGGSIVLDFKHKTTQLTFVAKLASVLTGSEWEGKEVSVKTITVQKAKLPASLTFSSGEVNWTAEKSISVAGCETGLTTTACAPSNPIMIAPASSVTVDLELSVGDKKKVYSNLPVKNDSKENLVTLEGNSHLVTFVITPPTTVTGAEAITVTAKVAKWTEGAKGTVEIQ